MKSAERLFKGLADTNRLRILNLLMHGELCVCDIQYVLGTPQPNVSRHLIYLKNSGLVSDRREGPRMYYRISPSATGVHQKLFALLQQVFDNESGFEDDRRKLRKAIENGSCTVSEWQPLSGVSYLRRTART